MSNTIPTTLDPICVPINLDAFVLHEKVCDSGETRILPIQQPNYVALRLDNSVIQHDVLPSADLHRTQPASVNPRISRAFTNQLKKLDPKDPNPKSSSGDNSALIQSRIGVYLSWSLPRGYRSGTAQAPPSTSAGASAPQAGDDVPQQPSFKSVPNRWVVVRVLNGSQVKPEDRFKAFIVESDVLRRPDKMNDDVDLEADVTPFVYFDPTKPDGPNLLDQQAEVFIGRTSPLDSKWTDNDNIKEAEKIDLNVMQSSNPFFADYQHHNASVFSMKDTLQISDGTYLTSASCDYLVCGYHSDVKGKDPFNANGIKGMLDDKLKAFFFDMSAELIRSTPNAGKSTANTSLVFHGVIKGVLFDRSKKPTTLGDTYAKSFTSTVDMEPVSVGTTPLESVITFLQAHEKDTALEQSLGDADLAKQIVDLSEQLYTAEADSYDSQVKAQDLIFAHNFGRGMPSGFNWVFDKKKEKGKSPTKPSTTRTGDQPSELDCLANLNELQRRLDAANRALDLLRWSMFAQFFNYCSDPDNRSDAKRSMYRTKIDNFRKAAVPLKQLVEVDLPKQINAIVGGNPPKVPARKVAADPFFKRSDPTLFLAGIDGGWPSEYLKNVKTRMGSELNSQSIDPKIGALVDYLPNLAPRDLIKRLLSESYGKDGTKADQLKSIGGKIWAGQPFCPIFVEWEAIYYNVGFNDDVWHIELASSPSTNNHKTVRYVNPQKLFEDPLQTSIIKDTRTVSGRIPILPQPSFSLAAIVNQVISTTPTEQLSEDLQKYKDPVERQKFIDRITALKFVSGQLTGLTDGLLTLVTGQHVKPNVRVEGQRTKPMNAAIQVTDKTIGLQQSDYQIISDQSAKTPYGSLVNFPKDGQQPFKGVTHGQLALTKVLIVDKFGQAICAPSPGARQDAINHPNFIHPCLSDQLCPTVLTDSSTKKDYLNTVYHTSSDVDVTSTNFPLSPFIQLTPALNQESRVNAAFMRKNFDDKGKFTSWSATTEWENPIFGWIVVNYADSALQIFTGDGIFYTEVRFGGPAATIVTPKYLPFAPPTDPEALVPDQLDNFIKQMQGSKGVAFMKGVWDMVARGIATMPFPPSDYAAYANAIVGKPLALVNIGWSLELAQPPLTAQHTLGPMPGQSGLPTELDIMQGYKFHVKIGDNERPYDGLLGYFHVGNKDIESSSEPTLASGETDWTSLYTYYAPGMAEYGDPEKKIVSAGDGDPRKPLIPSAYPTLRPYFLDPSKYQTGSTGYAAAQSSKMMVKMCIIDPYTPTHLYSSILPIKALQLSSWTVQAAFKNMTAFFSASVFLKNDVPKTFDEDAILHPDSWVTKQNTPTVSKDAAQVKIPIAGGKGLWNWLQPYPPATSATGDSANRPRYNALDVQNEDGKLPDAPAPYTVVEGFLQLARPLIQSDDQ